ncbi:MAG: ThuA domain-containing protein [Mucilaginibacter sp.]
MKDQKTTGPLKVVWVMAALLLCTSMAWAKPNPKVLIFCKTAVFPHKSIPAGIAAIKKLGAENKFDVDTTTDVSKFTDANLKQYATIIFLSPTSNMQKVVFKDSVNKEAFKKYIEKGGGFLGIHSATDFGYEWPWYGQLVGGYFLGHPRKNVQTATLKVIDKNNPATKALPDTWTRTDEYYSFKPGSNPKDLHVLITLDESTEDYGTQTNLKMGDFHPMAWYHDYDGGRAFYTALGHTDESFSDPLVLDHILGALQYTMGKKYKGKKQ